jgi:hypothetical protein
MDLKKIIKHQRYEAGYAKRLGALVAADFHINATEALEEFQRRSAAEPERKHGNESR